MMRDGHFSRITFSRFTHRAMKFTDFILHLRLHWQVLLSTLFLWGFLLSGGEIGPPFWVVFGIFHMLFYGGATALNSYYDQDEGPIGGVWNPPKVTRDLLVFAVAVQIVGLVLIFFIEVINRKV